MRASKSSYNRSRGSVRRQWIAHPKGVVPRGNRCSQTGCAGRCARATFCPGNGRGSLTPASAAHSVSDNIAISIHLSSLLATQWAMGRLSGFRVDLRALLSGYIYSGFAISPL